MIKLYALVIVASLALAGCTAQTEQPASDKVSGGNNNQPQAETVSMPNLVNVTESEATTWLRSNSYKFNVSSNYGFNPKLSLCVGGKGLVIGQSPQSGTQVTNNFGTSVRLEVDCEWR
jgi:beta-lactam-binding protein with PASTA domain